LAEIRAISVDEMRTLTIFPSSIRSEGELRLGVSGVDPELTWKLAAVPVARTVVRHLDGDSVDSLADLYGPAEVLRFIGRFDDGGVLDGILTWRYDSWNETAWLCDIRVQEDARRQGIGSRLVQELLWAAVREDARGIMLETQTTNVPAIAFYLGHGFRLVGLNTAMYGEPGDRSADPAIYFWRTLVASDRLKS